MEPGVTPTHAIMRPDDAKLSSPSPIWPATARRSTRVETHHDDREQPFLSDSVGYRSCSASRRCRPSGVRFHGENGGGLRAEDVQRRGRRRPLVPAGVIGQRAGQFSTVLVDIRNHPPACARSRLCRKRSRPRLPGGLTPCSLKSSFRCRNLLQFLARAQLPHPRTPVSAGSHRNGW